MARRHSTFQRSVRRRPGGAPTPAPFPAPFPARFQAPLSTPLSAVARSLATLVVLAAATAMVACQAFTSDFAEFDGERVRNSRDRAAQQDAMLELRLGALLETSLEEAGVDCWLVVADGQDGDPMVSMLTVSTTRLEGKGALLLCGGERPARIAIGRGFAPNAAFYDVGSPSREEPLEALLNRELQALEPQRIAINDARSFAVADGLTAANARWVRQRLDPEMAERLVSSRPIVERFLSTQLEAETPLFIESARLTAAILEQVLSDRVVVAAGTSLGDLEWAVRERAAQLAVDLPYPPRTHVYRPGATLEIERRMELDLILQPGDLVFLSAGIRYLGYANRAGRWAYLLPSGEREAPAWVGEALSALADGATRLVETLAVGQGIDQIDRAALAALTGLTDGRAAVDRVGRLAEGSMDPAAAAAVSGSWHREFQVAADTGLVITLESTFEPPVGGAGPWKVLFVDTALITAAGARFLTPPQRMPLLID